MKTAFFFFCRLDKIQKMKNIVTTAVGNTEGVPPVPLVSETNLKPQRSAPQGCKQTVLFRVYRCRIVLLNFSKNEYVVQYCH